MSEDTYRKQQDYDTLVQLIINGNDRYHGISSTYLTANSILVGVSFLAIGKLPHLITMCIAISGMFICLQWWISLSRCRRLNQRRIRQLKEIETDLGSGIFHDGQECLDRGKHSNRWYGKRAASMPLIFTFLYFLVLISRILNLCKITVP